MVTLLLAVIYIAFISLGLPDGLLGGSWPAMQKDFGVPYSSAGFVSMIVSCGTIVSSVFSGRILGRFGTGRVTAASVALTCAALFGFALTPSFWWLLIAAVPLGLGAGSVDAGLNAYIAEHYESRHMSWLHCFWGIGAMAGPFLVSRVLDAGGSWRIGYLAIAILQAVLVVVLFRAVPLWDKVRRRSVGETASAPASGARKSLFFPLGVRGVKYSLVAFFFYCGIEATMGLWGGSFLFKTRGLSPAAAATWVSLFFGSITLGRLLTGFVTFRVSNVNLIRYGCLVAFGGALLMALPLPLPCALAGFLLVGLGCAPLFPCMLHETPARFGVEHARDIMAFQMAMAYTGTTLLPPAFGFIASALSMSAMPYFLLAYAVALAGCSEILRRRAAR